MSRADVERSLALEEYASAASGNAMATKAIRDEFGVFPLHLSAKDADRRPDLVAKWRGARRRYLEAIKTIQKLGLAKQAYVRTSPAQVRT